MGYVRLRARQSGVRSLSWAGLLEVATTAAPEGAYSVSVEALTGGKSQDALALNYALVNSVSSSKQDGPLLDLGGISEPVGLDDVRQIL